MLLTVICFIYVLSFKEYVNSMDMFAGLNQLGDIIGCAIFFAAALVLLFIFRLILNVLKLRNNENSGEKVKYKRNIGPITNTSKASKKIPQILFCLFRKKVILNPFDSALNAI